MRSNISCIMDSWLPRMIEMVVAIKQPTDRLQFFEAVSEVFSIDDCAVSKGVFHIAKFFVAKFFVAKFFANIRNSLHMSKYSIKKYLSRGRGI